MIGQLLTLPLRIGARGTQLVLRTAEGVVGRAAMGAMQIVGTVKRGDTSSGHENGNAAASSSSGPSAASKQSTAVREQSPSASAAAPSRETSAPRTPPRSRGMTPASERPTPIVSAPQPQDVEQPLAPEPVHVSEEPELVREEAEPGAEDGAGAAVRVQPPWEGYERMAAREVIARLGDASPAELAAVELYERTHRSRQTVLEAAERRLKAANGRG